jgi:hypothetical protein
MATEERGPEQETAHDEKRRAVEETHIDKADATPEVEQETANVKKAAATQTEDEDGGD